MIDKHLLAIHYYLRASLYDVTYQKTAVIVRSSDVTQLFDAFRKMC